MTTAAAARTSDVVDCCSTNTRCFSVSALDGQSLLSFHQQKLDDNRRGSDQVSPAGRRAIGAIGPV